MMLNPLALPTLWLAWSAQYGRAAGFAYGCLLREQVLNHAALVQHWLGCPNPLEMPLPNATADSCGGGSALADAQHAADGVRR